MRGDEGSAVRRSGKGRVGADMIGIIGAATAVLAAGAWTAVGAERDMNRPYHLETVRVGAVDAVLTNRIHAPKVSAQEWIIAAPIPPEHPTQSGVTLRLRVEGSDATGRRGVELSELRRPILTAQVPVKGEALKSSIGFHLDYAATLHRRKLVPGKPKAAVAQLDEAERRRFLASTEITNWKDTGFQEWRDATGLRRREGEKDLAFAYRAFVDLAGRGTYKANGGDLRPSEVCRTLETDCGGFALLITAVLRAGGVPARTLWGRWAMPEQGDYKQWHVKGEFFAEGVGWVPVELAGAIAWHDVGADACFGIDEGNFITLHVDTDMVIDSLRFGQQDIGWRQGVLWWVFGGGALDDLVESESWQVTKRGERP